MKSQKYNHITRVLLTIGLFSMAIPTLAAQVPPGTVLAEKQELVRNNGSEPSSNTARCSSARVVCWLMPK